MLYCSKCGKEISIKERNKSISKTILECSECNSRYRMKYLKILLFTQTILIFLFNDNIGNFIPEINLFIDSLIKAFIVVSITHVMFFILSFFMKYEKVDESEEVY